ncbi:alpha/beta hydrolase [Paracoccus sp. TOH]|uniref:alpha/beta hydrolase n=1 Tax=Paracoccus sp. TOH TaxID=1263728 RepID=UPI00339DA6A9
MTGHRRRIGSIGGRGPNAGIVEQPTWTRPCPDRWLTEIAGALLMHPGSVLVGHSLGAVAAGEAVAAMVAVQGGRCAAGGGAGAAPPDQSGSLSAAGPVLPAAAWNLLLGTEMLLWPLLRPGPGGSPRQARKPRLPLRTAGAACCRITASLCKYVIISLSTACLSSPGILPVLPRFSGTPEIRAGTFLTPHGFVGRLNQSVYTQGLLENGRFRE